MVVSSVPPELQGLFRHLDSLTHAQLPQLRVDGLGHIPGANVAQKREHASHTQTTVASKLHHACGAAPLHQRLAVALVVEQPDRPQESHEQGPWAKLGIEQPLVVLGILTLEQGCCPVVGGFVHVREGTLDELVSSIEQLVAKLVGYLVERGWCLVDCLGAFEVAAEPDVPVIPGLFAHVIFEAPRGVRPYHDYW